MKLSSKFNIPKFNQSQPSCYAEWEQRILKQSLKIQEQGDLLAQISKNANANKNSILCTEVSEMSFEVPEFYPHLGKSLSCFQHNRNQSLAAITAQTQDSFLESLEEIKSRCSRKTYNLVHDRIYSQESQARCQKKLEREIRHNQTLINKIHKLTKQKIELENKIQNHQTIRHYPSQKSFRLASRNQNFEKEVTRVKLEKSLAQKEKLGLDFKKILMKQLQIINQAKKENQQLKQYIIKMGDQILHKTSSKQAQKHKQLKSLLQTNKKSNQKYQKQKQELILCFYEEIQQILSAIKKQLLSQNIHSDRKIRQ